MVEVGEILPYVNTGVGWSISDADMVKVYNELEEAEIVPRLFFGMDMDVKKFFQLMQSPTNSVCLALTDTKEPGMLAWLNSWGYNYAFGHFTGFKRSWGASQKFMKAILDYWFSFKRSSGEPILDLILGLTPKDNRLAIRAAQRAGFKIMATIDEVKFGADPTTHVGGVWTALTRGEHYGRRG